MEELEKIMLFIQACEKLKSTYRYTTTSGGRKESTADHTRRWSVMVLLLGDKIGKDIDVSHAVRLALFHDLPEALVGDIDAYAYEIKKYPERKIEKQKEERDAMGYLRDILSGEQGDEIFSYREEYEAGLTKEAKFVKALDKIETLHQFIDAGQKDFEDEASDFLATYADKCVSNYPELNDILSITKTKLKKTYKLWGLEWKDRYDIHGRN